MLREGEAMTEEASEVLVLTDSEGNIYALPRRLVERARVPEELKSVFQTFRLDSGRAARAFGRNVLFGTHPKFLPGASGRDVPRTVDCYGTLIGWSQ
jgi:hypothetical protein